ncbi:formin BNI1-like [Papaver somniferum]|uniref:formin BNI1-like n=1 Tax=Papaver somniferum TaxID=3469 RepID=UPI000E6F7F7D|nr:formin BNI1-like [Papaver somniferum]
MESEKRSSHRSGSEYFICFTARNSSSMKISSKSIQSPGRHSGKFGESSASLSSSLSRRLRSNGSIKRSPMFPTGSQKKKGSSLETTAAEPSSPKVTCIGQVRVKTKKQGQKFRRRSKRKGDLSFRKTEQNHQQPQECLPHRNQRWVHLTLSICEALKTFGAEFNCLLPCTKSYSCLTGEKSDQKRNGRQTTERNNSSCREVFANWVMTGLHENDQNEMNMDNNDNEMELVVSRREDEMRRVKREEMIGEIEMQILEEKRVSICRSEVEQGEEGRVSICIPPKNALLLMRCRSEPFRNSALANRFWESPIRNKEEENYLQREAVIVAEEVDTDDRESGDEEEEVEDDTGDENELKSELEEENFCKTPEKEENADISLDEHHEKENQDIEEEEIHVIVAEEKVIDNGCSAIEPLVEVDILKIEECEEEPIIQVKEQELMLELSEERIESRRPSISSGRVSFSSCTKSIHEEEETEQCPEQVKMAVFEETVKEDKVAEPRISVEKRETMEINKQGDEELAEELKSKEREKGDHELPDCLLLMMCEPKLSMEVSKETWVCSTDFIRFRPERKLIQNNGGDNDHSKKRNSTDSKGRLSTDSKSRLSTDSNPSNGRPPLHGKHQKPPTPPRRSISKPPPPPPPAEVAPPIEHSTSPSSMATMIEQKFVHAVAYEPFVLTRCKSEPLKSSAKLAPEACFWKSMKLEPHTQGPPNLGVGAATGIGF